MLGPEIDASAERLRAIETALSDHDRRLSDSGLVIWVGTEPTFTDRLSYDGEWVGEALGPAKLERAQRFAAMLATRVPSAVLLRCVGRQYPEEKTPRWSFGLYWRREAGKVWHLPPDPLMGGRASDAMAPRRLLKEFEAALRRKQHTSRRVLLTEAPHPPIPIEQADEGQTPTLPYRVLYGVRGEELGELDAEAQEQCGRHPLGGEAIPTAGLCDRLAERGLALICIGDAGGEHPGVVRVELPQLSSVSQFSDLLELIGDACRAAMVEGLILGGYPPPVDRDVAWATITPDPGVIEINTAPCAGTRGLLHDSRILYQVAESIGLSPLRMHFNGEQVDSGGGGQITLGGPSFEESPFFLQPQLLPRLVCFFSHHPSLSYLFAVDSVGGSSQSPRADEGSVETLGELGLALELLQRAEPTPEEIWSALAPFLVDRFGNSHRAELNIEKLANPHLPGRGRLGVVEFRAFRMADTPERAACLAALLRAIAAHLATQTAPAQLKLWGQELHDRFALPSQLELDLLEVLQELESNGWGLAPAIAAELAREQRLLARVPLWAGAVLELRQAIEFWPLVGDLAAQSGTTRLVDSSTRRYELRLRCPEEQVQSWRLAVDGYEIPWVAISDASGPLLVRAIRCRSFVPSPGLHPKLAAHGPLSALVYRSEEDRAATVSLHWWKVDGGAYEGLPADIDEAKRRTAARCTVEHVSKPEREPPAPPAGSLSAWAFDTRWA